MAYMEGQTARRLLGVDDVNTFVVNAKPGARAAVEEKLKSLCGKSGLLLQSFADLRRRIDTIINGVVASFGCCWPGFIIGAFGWPTR